MSAVKAYFDTNIFVYLYSDTEFLKRQKALDALNQYGRVISTQVLNEFCNVCIRKTKMDKSAIEAAVMKICSVCKVAVITEATIRKALKIHGKYGYSYYDSLMVASALDSGCQLLVSEDMSDNQIIEGVLTIKNIFKP